MDYNKAASNGVYVDVGQAAIIRSGGNMTRLATDGVVGCLGVVIKNTVTGDMGLIHIMANLSGSNLHEEYDNLIKPTIDGLLSEDQTLDVKIFGGAYDEDNKISGQQFTDAVIEKLNSFENVDITSILIGSTPHPTGVMIDVSIGDIVPKTKMVESYDEALNESENIAELDSFSRPESDPLYFGMVYEEPKTNTGASNAPDLPLAVGPAMTFILFII